MGTLPSSQRYSCQKLVRIAIAAVPLTVYVLVSYEVLPVFLLTPVLRMLMVLLLSFGMWNLWHGTRTRNPQVVGQSITDLAYGGLLIGYTLGLTSGALWVPTLFGAMLGSWVVERVLARVWEH